jgi:hypothetical protein
MSEHPRWSCVTEVRPLTAVKESTGDLELQKEEVFQKMSSIPRRHVRLRGNNSGLTNRASQFMFPLRKIPLISELWVVSAKLVTNRQRTAVENLGYQRLNIDVKCTSSSVSDYSGCRKWLVEAFPSSTDV